MVIERDLREERESYDALVGDKGRPSHPVRLGFDVLDNPGEYKDIISYWRNYEERFFHTSDRFVFCRQLKRWKDFREFQQKIRHYHIQRDTFSDYQQRVREHRQRHGLEGDVELGQVRDEQSES